MLQNAAMHESLQQLGTLLGIAPGYHDIRGEYHPVRDEPLQRLIGAMGVPCDSAADTQASLSRLAAYSLALPACKVLVAGRDPWQLVLPDDIAAQAPEWDIQLEHGGTLSAASAAQVLTLPALPLGYHRLISRDRQFHLLLIIAPDRCYQPGWLQRSKKTWGVSLQLYGLRAHGEWGVGDYGGLARLIDWVADQGGGVVGINPLHALPVHDPEHASPYSPISREFFHPLYLDVTAIEEFAECAEARAEFADAHFQTRLRWLDQHDLVHYNDVAAMKLPLLEMLYRQFRRAHLDTGSARGQAFRAFQHQGGEALFRYALFCALQMQFHHLEPATQGWQDWPRAYHDFHNPAVAAYARANVEAVEFHQYLQWQCEIQLARAGKTAWDRQMRIGLYGDVAVGAHPSGADTWIDPQCYALAASIGAPPDAFAPQGQDWGLPPWIPHQLKAAGYAPFIRMLRANMRHAGALRIDHIMGLFRLFWVPAGMTAADGAYVHYAHEDLFAILALESQRNACAVIGEDLGTVPDEVRALMAQYGLLSTRLMMFEKRWDGTFKAPDEYPVMAVGSFGSHDTPTFNGYWTGRDLEWHHRLGTLADANEQDSQHGQRDRDKAQLVEALEMNGCAPPGHVDTPSAELAASVYRCLAKSACAIVLVSAEDLLGTYETPNIPGTVDQHPNWRRRLPLALEDWHWNPRVQTLLDAVRTRG
jgi:(1->4)-alpha-D-glucan 1-alpha-D-glucosylmutase